MKITFGILASTNDDYSSFLDIWIDNIKRFKAGPYKDLIDFYFLYFEPDRSHSVIEKENGCYYDYYSEYIPNISIMDSFLKRTVSLMDYLRDNNKLGTFFIRTNLSTLFNLNLFVKWSRTIPKKNLIAGSIIDHLNLIYTTISGANILLTRDLVNFVLNNKEHLLDESVLEGDDERISSLIIENIEVDLLLMKRLDFIESEYVKPACIVFQSGKVLDNLFCYRFKTFDRKNDIKLMRIMFNNIYSISFNTHSFALSLVNDPNYVFKSTFINQNDYEKLTYDAFQIKVQSDIMKKHNRYLNVSLKN
jgi:hypothetical protein